MSNFKFGREYTPSGRVRRLRAAWTPELAQDIQAFHNVDIEEELTRILSQEMAAQIDNDIINTLRQEIERTLDRSEIINHIKLGR